MKLKEKKNAQACITLKNLLQFHINSPDINNEKAVLLAVDETLGNCLNLTEIIPQASVRYDVNEQRLDIDVPQAWVMKNYQNYVDPSLWENGINAAMLSYNLNGYHSETLVEEMTAFMLLLTVDEFRCMATACLRQLQLDDRFWQ